VTTLEIISALLILAAAILGGYGPLSRRTLTAAHITFPNGESFAAGVFLALSLIIMLPAGTHLFDKVLTPPHFPWSALVAIIAFLLMLAIDHAAAHARAHSATLSQESLTPASIPIIMTVMIAIPSFLLGAALSLSERDAAIFILIAVLAHKGSAGFGLALTIVRSRLSQKQSLILYGLFCCSTPVGIIVGANALTLIDPHTLVFVKAIALSLAAGVFLYMATVHDLERAPLICHCKTMRRFAIMISGLILTAAVRAILGLAHAT
jgi:zinc transporter 1/2/3